MPITGVSGTSKIRWIRKIPALKMVMLGSVCLSIYTMVLSLHSVIDGTNSFAFQDSLISADSNEYHERNAEMELNDLPRHKRNLQYSPVLEYLGIKKPKRSTEVNKIRIYDYEDVEYTSLYEERNDNISHSNEDNKYIVQPKFNAQRNGTKSLPQAIIIGVKKGGTRALLEFLRLHPDIRAPGPEPHFFDKNYNKGLQWYREQMPPTDEGQLTIEKTPSYFVTKDVPRRIFKMSKDTKLIVVVRDPVTRAISDYTQAISKRPDIKTFEKFAFLDNNTRLVDTSWGAIKIGVYSKHLEKWLQFFPMDHFHFVSGEKLITSPAEEVAKVQEFLGLRKFITKWNFYMNGSKGFPCLRKTGSGKPHCLDKSKGRPHPRVDPDIIRRLRDFYRPFNAKFYQMSGRDFGWQ